MATKNDAEIDVSELAQPTDAGLEARVKDFSELLDQIESMTSKKKQLWREIYENAVTDRQNTFLLFKELYKIVKAKPMEHAVHDKSISSYLERMAKCNDQLIKLADLIAAAEKKDATIDADDMYTRISDSGR